MADTTRGMIRYTSREYAAIMEDFFAMVPQLTDLWAPTADSDPGVVLGKVLASAADMLGVNLDWFANEIFGPSVTQRKNAEKLFALIGYDLGWYTAARTEVTFTNNTVDSAKLDFGFNGNNFATLNAYTDITDAPRVITYNILPLTNAYGALDSRSRRATTSSNLDVFADTDSVSLAVGESVTRVAVEGELRNYSVSVAAVKQNNYIITLPSQHLDTTAVWLKARPSLSSESFLSTQWVQVVSPADFIDPEPRFAVTYDNYSNAQVQISNYINQLDNYDSNYLTIYWIDTSGVIGCVNTDVLSNYLPAKPSSNVYDAQGLTISNLANTVQLPHTNTVTGASPETAKQAYLNSRKYINTWDSLITLPDYVRFIQREPGVDAGTVLDCQKALEINLAIYNNPSLTDAQKAKLYITNNDFPADDNPIFDWGQVLGLGFDPTDPQRFVFSANFKTYTAMCFAVHNNFLPSNYGQGRISNAQVRATTKFQQYRMPPLVEDGIESDYEPLGALSVKLQFGFTRVFSFYVVGVITPTAPVSSDVAATLVAEAKQALALFYAPSTIGYGVLPTLNDIIDIVEGADTRIKHFDPGSRTIPGIYWQGCDIEYFNPISIARMTDPGPTGVNIIVDPAYLRS
jgi:hypothetical protein